MQPRHYYFLLFLSVLIIAVLIVLAWNNPETALAPVAKESIESRENPAPPSAAPIIDADQFLPDLEVQPLGEAHIEGGAAGRRTLRFPGTFMNTGDGQLELLSAPDAAANIIRATQRIYKKDGTTEERPVGNFVFHPTHSHWHFEDFVEFEIWSLKNGSEIDQKLLSTGKMTFCIHDYAPLPENFPGKPSTIVYPWCGSSVDIQGISVGWADTYLADVPGQELDISSLPPGIYAFRSVVDPENRILEKDETNNFSVSFIEIAGNTVRVLAAPPL